MSELERLVLDELYWSAFRGDHHIEWKLKDIVRRAGMEDAYRGFEYAMNEKEGSHVEVYGSLEEE